MPSRTSNANAVSSRDTDAFWMRRALRLARRGLGRTAPNPAVGAVVVRDGQLLGQGWHRQAGQPHAEVEALRNARRRGHDPAGATLYVTLEPCSTQGRTPPCTDAIREARLARVVVGATDPNPRHRGRGFRVLRRAGIAVTYGVLGEICTRLNEAFNHWILHGTPWITVKAAMTVDGKIATARGESKWITGPKARALAMQWRAHSGAIIVGIETVLLDNPRLTVRTAGSTRSNRQPLRVVLDSRGRTPLSCQLVRDAQASRTRLVVTRQAPAARVKRLRQHVQVWIAPARQGRIHLGWLLRRLGREGVTSALVEGGGEVNAAFLLGRHAHRITFFLAPKILGGRDSRRAVAGNGARTWNEILRLAEVTWQRVGEDFLLTARVRDSVPRLR
jgi:diaminohydroxyphosphoribosylaminopyrimidine deaminase/5-amino-6-(5-phosphoribosylamino)uracil reductase